MSVVGIALFVLAVVLAGCLLRYAWGWQDAKARFAKPIQSRRSAPQESVR